MRLCCHPLMLPLLALAAGCATGSETAPGVAVITEPGIRAHIEVLASDEFEGRAPGTPGEEKTVQYLVEQFTAVGLEPGNPDGSFLQTVDMVGLTAVPRASFRVGSRTIALGSPADYVAMTRRTVPQVTLANSDLVFVGYGVVAPEYQWDDYKDVDVTGKTIVMLINDPAVPDAADPSKLDDALFKGRAMTYYGRWTYKYEIATARGAAAAIIIHETDPAGYPWEVVQVGWARENIDVRAADGNAGRVGVESWITLEKAKELFAAAGQDFDQLKAAARTREFRPVSLGGTATFTIDNTIRDIQSGNVLGKLSGSDPALASEYLVYSAHWDHLGRDPSLAGDQIFNGALDNASGTAALLELAKAFKAMPTPPKRSVIFLAVTAEEQGLLGAKYYAANPLYPLEKTLANINIDGINQWGRTRDVVVIGYGNSTLDDVLAEVAGARQRVLAPDPEPGKGYFFRSDHFEFAKKGVPALYIESGTEFLGKPEGYGQQKRDEYVANDYHKPSDDMKLDWDLSGGVEDVQMLFEVGWRVLQGPTWPEWKPGTEFKSIREAMLAR